MEVIGVQEVRRNLRRYLARTAQGESFTITDRGRAVASLVPAGGDPWAHLIPPRSSAEPGQGVLEAGVDLSGALARLRDQER